ncbi:MAG: DUF2393 family protein [Sulfurimonas sp.]|nr:DUF2393 family protein [Sulfurimonas sp.]
MMKEKIVAFIHELIIYDYILFGSSFILFILFITLAIVVRKRVGFSLFLVLLSFILLLALPSLGYVKMHEYLFKNNIQVISEKKLVFTEAIVVKGTLTNESKFDFKTCHVTAKVCKATGNKYKDFIFTFKPIMKMSILEEDLKIGETREFKIIVEPFTYANDYNASVKADCSAFH